MVRQSGQYNFEKEQIIVNKQWNTDLLEEWLIDYDDKEVVKFIKYGWPLNAENTEVNTEVPPNQKGAQQNPQKIREYLQEEINNGSVIGPFIKNPFGKSARFSPLDTRPKKNSDDLSHFEFITPFQREFCE